MRRNKYDYQTESIWDKACECHCASTECTIDSHRLCAVCNKTIVYECHESNIKFVNSKYMWNADYIIPPSHGGWRLDKNLHAVHLECNRVKRKPLGSHMKKYLNKGQRSSVIEYEYDETSILVRFNTDKIYLYTVRRCGPEGIAKLKQLADEGSGLASCIRTDFNDHFEWSMKPDWWEWYI